MAHGPAEPPGQTPRRGGAAAPRAPPPGPRRGPTWARVQQDDGHEVVRAAHGATAPCRGSCRLPARAQPGAPAAPAVGRRGACPATAPPRTRGLTTRRGAPNPPPARPGPAPPAAPSPRRAPRQPWPHGRLWGSPLPVRVPVPVPIPVPAAALTCGRAGPGVSPATADGSTGMRQRDRDARGGGGAGTGTGRGGQGWTDTGMGCRDGGGGAQEQREQRDGDTESAGDRQHSTGCGGTQDREVTLPGVGTGSWGHEGIYSLGRGHGGAGGHGGTGRATPPERGWG